MCANTRAGYVRQACYSARQVDAARLLEGAVDTHVHSAPDLVPRKLDDIAAAQQARDAGMAAIVLKNHFFSTAMRASLVESVVPGVRVIGSIVLNQPMGGVNPWAVEAAARAGVKVVWMPTAHAANQLDREAQPGGRPHRAAMTLPGRDARVRVFDGSGAPTPDTEAVLEIVRDRGMLLATGHLSPDEVDRLTERAIQMGLRKLVATHPDLPSIGMPVALQQRLADRGVFFERTFNVTSPPDATLSMAELAARIRQVGASSTILATDFGQETNPLPVEGLASYVEGLSANGFSEAEVRQMASEHARRLLDV
jgi:hypothetical protein